ncbi:MAG: NADP-specific glutamate dehydrogenase [Verrucomicrobiales bacterium]
MTPAEEKELSTFMKGLRKRNPHEDEFHQAVCEVATSIMPWYLRNETYQKAEILERLTEPDRIITFRVTWETDTGEIRANRAWRVQFSHALGPYKGGMRFHPATTQSILKFLGFEQIFKNSLTGLPMGGAKGGSNFNPKGKSEREVMRFCHSLMTELHRHIGEDIDVPAGDIGVGSREVSFMFGQYMRLENRWGGVLTGKGLSFGGSAVRTEATGWGCIYFCEAMLNQHNHPIEGKRVAISGSGNVALYAAQKLIAKGAKVVAMSDSGGFIHAEQGLDEEQWNDIREMKETHRGRLSDYQSAGIEYHKGARPWRVPCDIAMPCATQNELDRSDAEKLVENGVVAVCEGANMPTTAEAVEVFRQANVLHAPGKASNAGGVAVSGLEQSQNAMRISWDKEEVDSRLRQIMKDIHRRCVEDGNQVDGPIDYIDGSNIAGFKKVAEAMLAYGAV